MAANPADFYGTDVACLEDADGLFTAVTGLPVVLQDVYHRVTTPSVLGPEGDDWGKDARRLLGLREDRALAQGNAFAICIQKDPRIFTADVKIRKGSGAHAYIMTIIGTTALGPFKLILGISQVTVAILETQQA